MTSWRHRVRRMRFVVLAALAVVVITLAAIIGLMQILLPLATRYPDFVARQLSFRLHRPVQFTAISSEWQPSGPRLTVRNLTLGPAHPGGTPITLPHASLKFDFGAWLRPAHRWITLRLGGMNLRVEHDASGWRVAGFASRAGETHSALQSLPVDLDLHDLRVDIVDDASGRAWHLLAPHLQVVNVGDSVRFGGVIQQTGTRQAARVAGRMNAASGDYDLYLATRGLDLAEAARDVDLHGYAVHDGQGDIEMWGSWRHRHLVSASMRYDLHELDVSGPDGRRAKLASFAGIFQAARDDHGWRLAWRGPGKSGSDIDASGGVVARITGGPGARRISAAARAVDATPWLAVLSMSPSMPAGMADWVADAAPGAILDQAALEWRQDGHYDLVARLGRVHAAAAGKLPGIALAHAVLHADDRALSLRLSPQPVTLAMTDVFRNPFRFKSLQGRFTAWREGGHWHVAADGLKFDGGGFAGNADATLVWSGKGRRPFVSAYATVDHADVTDAKAFWPWRSMPPSLIAWLDRALVSGRVTSGRVLLRGDLDDWPFMHQRGRFEAAGTVKDAAFDFADGWPAATNVDAEVDFVDNGMHIVASHATVRGVTVSHATVRGVTVSHAEARIPDFHHGILGLEVEGSGNGASLLDFVRHSPVGAGAAKALDGLAIGGTGKFGIELSIPLHDASQFALHGKLDLADADVRADKWKLAMQGLSGPLVIANHGFHAAGLRATFHGAPATLSIAVGDNVADPAHVVEASLDTRNSLQALASDYPDLAGLLAHASGAAPFHVGVDVSAGHDGTPAASELTVQSNLRGVALDFPAPLAKPADTALPFKLRLQLPPAGAALSVSLGDVLQVRGRLADAASGIPTALAVAFGPVPPPLIPDGGLVVNGHATSLDVSGWIQQALPGTSNSGFPTLDSAHVTTDHASVFGTPIGALRFDYTGGGDHATIALDGPAVKGTLQVPTSGLMQRGISANLQRLYWPEPPQPERPGAPEAPPVTSPVPPMLVPPLLVSVDDLRIGDARLGKVALESSPTLTGMHVARLSASNAGFSLQATGDWNGGALSSQSHFVADITSRDFGKALSAFGFGGLLAGGEDAHVHLDGTWPGPPSSFSLGWTTGSLSVDVGHGRILAVKPGLGRMLGLLSLRELPSRLALHFGDVFKSGFGFDHASAHFTLKDGSAFTDDMLIKAPAAQIAMHGRTGFRAHDYDLTVDVTPHVGGTLPVVGAVLGGPVGAAAGLVVQGLIGKGLNRAAGNVYHVTGSWEKPKIEEIDSTPGDAAPASAGSVAPKPASSVPAPAATTMPAPGSVLPPAASSVPPAAASAPAPAAPETAGG